MLKLLFTYQPGNLPHPLEWYYELGDDRVRYVFGGGVIIVQLFSRDNGWLNLFKEELVDGRGQTFAERAEKTIKILNEKVIMFLDGY